MMSDETTIERLTRERNEKDALWRAVTEQADSCLSEWAREKARAEAAEAALAKAQQERNETEAMRLKERKRAEALSAQLAKAREALRSIGYDPDYDLPVEHANSDLNARMHWFGRAATYQGLARAALAPAKPESRIENKKSKLAG